MAANDARILRMTPLHNDFFFLRHGQSEANVAGLIASSPERAIEHFGLTEIGQQQVFTTVHHAREKLRGAKIHASDFKRTVETAEIAAEILSVPLTQSAALRERGFGEWEGTSDGNYQHVWTADAQNPDHENHGVESVTQVASRMCQYLLQLDRLCEGETFLIVSHGDPLQILITAMTNEDLRAHRNLEPLGTAELRALSITPDA